MLNSCSQKYWVFIDFVDTSRRGVRLYYKKESNAAKLHSCLQKKLKTDMSFTFYDRFMHEIPYDAVIEPFKAIIAIENRPRRCC